MSFTIRSLFTSLVVAPVLLAAPMAAQQNGDGTNAASVNGVAPAALETQADSAFRVARRALDAGDYRQAAELFGQVTDRYPRASQAAEALYWQAFAYFRAGSVSNLGSALAALESLNSRYPASVVNRNDAGPLRIRVCGELARRGDSRCAEDVATAAQASGQNVSRGTAAQGQNQSCPGENDENDERIMALNALMNMNSDVAVPILERTLARRDACSQGLRKKAVFIISQKRSEKVIDVLLKVAREDPAVEVREQAIFWLSNVRDDRVVDILADLVTTSTEPGIQEKAIFALSNTQSAKASQVLRDIAQRDNAPKAAREQAIFWLGNRRDADATAFLRTLYGRLTDQDLKERVLFSVANQRGDDNGKWLLDIAMNQNEPMELRKNALFHAGNNRAASVADMGALYDRITDKQMKEQVIFTLAQRRETEAADKLMAIAGKDADKDMRSKAIFWLGQSRDPRVLKFLEELINR